MSLYIQYECADIKELGTADNEVADSTNDYCSVMTALMKKTNHFQALKTDNAGKGNIKQYNALVNYIKSKNYGAMDGSLFEYTKVVQRFSNILWEVDPNYYKLESRKFMFPESVTKLFLGFCNSKNNGHVVQPINKTSLSLKITNLLPLCDI